jgi:hypothetical protein
MARALCRTYMVATSESCQRQTWQVDGPSLNQVNGLMLFLLERTLTGLSCLAAAIDTNLQEHLVQAPPPSLPNRKCTTTDRN